MLTSTFCHIPGVSAATEAQLWSQGIHSWDAMHQQTRPVFSLARNYAVLECLRESEQRLLASDPAFFGDRLPSKHHWRLFSRFRHSVAYLDIETTGLSKHRDSITTVALYDGKELHCYVQGRNLDALREDLLRYQMLVTYNGKAFDIPFLEHVLGISLPQPHIDLMHLMRSLGFKGGLKGCEKQLGLVRDGLDGVNGLFAILLWRDYLESRNENALETLLAYNAEDAINLEVLMVEAYNLKLRETPFFDRLRLPLPARPPVPFRADAATIERLRNRLPADQMLPFRAGR